MWQHGDQQKSDYDDSDNGKEDRLLPLRDLRLELLLKFHRFLLPLKGEFVILGVLFVEVADFCQERDDLIFRHDLRRLLSKQPLRKPDWRHEHVHRVRKECGLVAFDQVTEPCERKGGGNQQQGDDPMPPDYDQR